MNQKRDSKDNELTQLTLTKLLMLIGMVLNEWKRPVKDDVAMDIALSDLTNGYAKYRALGRRDGYKHYINPSEYGEIVWLLTSSWSHEAIAKKFNVAVDTVREISTERQRGIFFKNWNPKTGEVKSGWAADRRPITNLT